MATTARYPPWLQRALLKESHSSRGSSSPGSPPSDDKPSPAASTREETGGGNDVWRAVELDDGKCVKTMLQDDKRLVFRRRDFLRDGGGGETLLHMAATIGSVEIVRCIIAFLEAEAVGEVRRNVVNAIDTQYSRTTPVIAACRSSAGLPAAKLEILRLLVRAGADLAKCDAHGDNVLHWCARTSNALLLRYFLNETDAAAVFSNNAKQETPLDIAQHQLNQKRTMSTSTVYNLLRNVDRECNLRLRMQIIHRGQQTLDERQSAHDNELLHRALDAVGGLVDKSNAIFAGALARAEHRRLEAERLHADAASEDARIGALKWLDSKEGKAYVKKQTPAATAEVKQQIHKGSIAKPKDMKKAVAIYISDTYVSSQQAAVRKTAASAFRANHPPYPLDGKASVAALAEKLGI